MVRTMSSLITLLWLKASDWSRVNCNFTIPQGDNETRSSSGSRSPPYEDAYERRYSDRSSPGGMSPGFEQGNRKSPSRPEVLNDWRREDRFGGRKKTEEESHSPEQVKDLGSSSPPIARPVREILGDSVIPLRVIEPPKPQVNRNSDSSVIAKVWLYHCHCKEYKNGIFFLRVERDNCDIFCSPNISPLHHRVV